MRNPETTVCFFKDIRKTLDAIPDRDAGILMKALFAEADGDMPELKDSQLANALFPMLADQMHRLDEFRKGKAEAGRIGGVKSGQVRSKREANTKQNEANTKQNEPPYPSPFPSPVYIGRNPKVQKAFGFSTERPDVNYDEIIAQRMREEREAAE